MLNKTPTKAHLAKTQQMYALADALSIRTHFTTEECKSLLVLHQRINDFGRMDRMRGREFLHYAFDMTDDVMLDLTFRAFDRNCDGVVDETEFIIGLSIIIRGDLTELIEFCYYVFDMNGDRSLARDELQHCLKGCMVLGYGLDADELEDAEKEIVEILMRKLDVNHDGQITYDDFTAACKTDPMMLVSVGPCLPTPKSMAAFLSTFTDDYRAYSGGDLEHVTFTGMERRRTSRFPSIISKGPSYYRSHPHLKL